MFQKNDKVEVNGKIGVITGYKQGEYWQVDFLNDGKSYFKEENIKPVVEEVRLGEAFNQGRFDGISDFRRCLFPYRLSSGLTNFMYSMGNAATTFYPHQFLPVIKFLESYTNNLLIADEVGLGKTIEAMYIWEELRVRENAKRLLIVCPARLREKWISDIKKYFNIEAQLIKAEAGNDSLLTKLQNTIRNPIQEKFAGVISIEAIRTAKGLKELLEIQRDKISSNHLFDLVVIDEAHYLRNRETKSYRTGERLRDTTNHLLLLSATPIQTGSENFFNLLTLLSPVEFVDQNSFDRSLIENRPLVQLANTLEANSSVDEVRVKLDNVLRIATYQDDPLFKHIDNNLKNICKNTSEKVKTLGKIKQRYFYNALVSRNRKRDVFEKRPIRDVTTIRFKLSPYESEFYERVSDYLSYEQHSSDEALITFRLIARQRQMASSIPAALSSWRSQKNIKPSNKEVENDNEELSDSVGRSTLLEPRASNAKPMPSFDEFDLEKLIKDDSKFNAIHKHICAILKQNPKEKIILFSFFRNTIAYLEKRFLDAKIRCTSIMGGGSLAQTQNIITQFEHDNTNILLTTEVCSEGVDLQFACYEINYDLPWNPMRLEQRIGRIDRIKQESPKIYIQNAICENTIEDCVLEKLYNRIAIFKDTLGDIEEILGKEIQTLQLNVFNARNTSPEVLEKIAEQSLQAIENKHQMAEKLETQVGLVSSDYQQFVLNNIKQSHKNKRHVMSDELFYAIQDTLKAYYHGSSIVYKSKDTGAVLINLSNDARDDFRRFKNIHLPSEDSTLLYSSSPVECTMQKQPENTTKEVIDIKHPLLRWLLDVAKKNTTKLTGCELLEISKKCADDFPNINTGLYVYYIRNWKSSGIQQRNELCHYVMNAETHTSLETNDAEILLALTMLHGKSYDFNQFSDDMYMAAGYALEQLGYRMIARSEKQQEEENLQNKTLCIQQKRYVTQAFEQKEAHILEIIQRHEENGSGLANAERIRLERERIIFNERIEAIDKKFTTVPSFDDIALGILIIKE